MIKKLFFNLSRVTLFLTFALCIGLATFALATDPYEDFVAAGVNADFSQSRSLPYVSSDMILLENVIVGNERYAAIMQWDASDVLKPIWVGTLSKVEIPFRTIIIDGNDADWAGILPVVEDPVGDEDPVYASIPGTDLANVYMARDDTYLYFLMTFHDGDPAVESMYVVELQRYLTQIHTPGDRSAVAAENGTVWVSDRTGLGDCRLSYPADHVGVGSAMVEWKVPVTAMQYPSDTPHPYFSPLPPPPGIENQFIRTYIHPFPHPSPVSDSNEQFTRPMIVNFYD